LKQHKPYHESDHVLNIAYNLLCGGTRLEHLELRRNDEVYAKALGAQRVWRQQPPSFFDHAVIDTDFSQTKHLDGWHEDQVRFIFGFDAQANLKAKLEELPETAWKPLVRPVKHTLKTSPRPASTPTGWWRCVSTSG